MKYDSENNEEMGRLHNLFIAEIDSCSLTPAEVCMVLDMISKNIKTLFEASVKGN